MVTIRLSSEDHERVTAAVAEAERGTSGEIVTIVAGRSDSYHDVGLHYAVLAMLLVPAVFALAPQRWLDCAMSLFGGWDVAPVHGPLAVLLFVALTVAFLVVRFALAWMPLRMALTPGATKTRRVRRRAIELFRVGAEKRTAGRTGVLLYLSLDEHRAEIVADEAIHHRVEPEIWGDAMAALISEVKAGRPGEGMAAAVAMIGTLLCAHLPEKGHNPNELPDRLIEL